MCAHLREWLNVERMEGRKGVFLPPENLEKNLRHPTVQSPPRPARKGGWGVAVGPGKPVTP